MRLTGILEIKMIKAAAVLSKGQLGDETQFGWADFTLWAFIHLRIRYWALIYMEVSCSRNSISFYLLNCHLHLGY